MNKKKQQHRFKYIARPLKVTGYFLLWVLAFVLLNTMLVVSIHAYIKS
jgi:hypothetical protein